MISVEQGQHIFFYFISDFFILPLLWDFIFSTILHTKHCPDNLAGLTCFWIHGSMEGFECKATISYYHCAFEGPKGRIKKFNFYSSKRFWAPFNICDENQPFARSGAGVENNEEQTCCYFLSFILFFTSYICTFP